MPKFIENNGILTFALIALTLIVAVVGGAVVIWGDPGALPFDTYMHDLEGFAAAIGLLAVGKGIAVHGSTDGGDSTDTKKKLTRI